MRAGDVMPSPPVRMGAVLAARVRPERPETLAASHRPARPGDPGATPESP